LCQEYVVERRAILPLATGRCEHLAGSGTVFKVDPSNNETMLYSFTCVSDGCTPQCNLVRDAAGNLYGIGTNGGVNQHGVVFKVNPAGNETTLRSFPDAPGDGAVPAAGLVRDSAGNLYGVAYGGGEFGYGNVFKLKP
jgi:uncharacterized repeat protein (TIGR03803 family)